MREETRLVGWCQETSRAGERHASVVVPSRGDVEDPERERERERRKRANLSVIGLIDTYHVLLALTHKLHNLPVVSSHFSDTFSVQHRAIVLDTDARRSIIALLIVPAVPVRVVALITIPRRKV